jgi:hypothetical protein
MRGSQQQEKEPILEPELPIIDTHHHLWDRGGWTYLLPELLADLNTGHNIVATVFEECSENRRAPRRHRQVHRRRWRPSAWPSLQDRPGLLDVGIDRNNVFGEIGVVLAAPPAIDLNRLVQGRGGPQTRCRANYF